MSKLIKKVVQDEYVLLNESSNNYKFSAAVAGFGMLLRNSKFKGDLTYQEVLTLAKNAKGKDEHGYRSEFINLVKTCALLGK